MNLSAQEAGSGLLHAAVHVLQVNATIGLDVQRVVVLLVPVDHQRHHHHGPNHKRARTRGWYHPDGQPRRSVPSLAGPTISGRGAVCAIAAGQAVCGAQLTGRAQLAHAKVVLADAPLVASVAFLLVNEQLVVQALVLHTLVQPGDLPQPQRGGAGLLGPIPVRLVRVAGEALASCFIVTGASMAGALLPACSKVLGPLNAPESPLGARLGGHAAVNSHPARLACALAIVPTFATGCARAAIGAVGQARDKDAVPQRHSLNFVVDHCSPFPTLQ
mmetsp:Transcript_34827/g.98738  ORF Transcript_34827/g.98738 Transcript_34827/m.98738 type:complete len:274 (+) Transcript_34827:81-902(+)